MEFDLNADSKYIIARFVIRAVYFLLRGTTAFFHSAFPNKINIVLSNSPEIPLNLTSPTFPEVIRLANVPEQR